MKNSLTAFLKNTAIGRILDRIPTRLIVLAVICISLTFITACSSRVIPEVPEFTGDCRKDLDNLVKYYVLPIERSR